MSKQKVGILILSLSFLFFNLGCSSDANDIANAQLCLDNIDDTQSQAVIDSLTSSCLSGINSLTSTEANTVKCTGNLMLGGITSAKIFDAFKASTGGQATSQAQLMLVIAVTKSNTLSENKAQAENTMNICNSSGVSGLSWIAGLSQIGTAIVNSASGFCSGNITTCDIKSNAQSILTGCSTNAGSCDPASIGSAAVAMNSAYCTGDNSSSEACQKFANAIGSGGKTTEQIGEALVLEFDPVN